MSCNCLHEVEKMLREHLGDPEATVDVGFSLFGNNLDVKPSGLAVTYREKKKDGTFSTKKKKKGLMPAFCPWCGKKYDHKEADHAEH